MYDDPYEILQLEHGAGDAEIRRAYLQMVRAHSPERDPEHFARIRNAYEQLQDPLERLRRQVFEFDTNDSLAAIEQSVRQVVWTERVSTKSLLKLGEQS